MTELSGILSLFFIAAAFLTSCDSQPPTLGKSHVRMLTTER
jgi:starvation-inducible outer membrane lipoprotein